MDSMLYPFIELILISVEYIVLKGTSTEYRWIFENLQANCKKDPLVIEIIDETFGYNQAKFSCSMIADEEWFDCDIGIYYFGEMKYLWEESNE